MTSRTHRPAPHPARYGAAPYAAAAYDAAPPAPRRRRPGRTAVRLLVAVVLVATSLYSAAFAAFRAVVTGTGCFVHCDPASAEPVLGILGGLGALGLLVLGPVLAVATWRRTRNRPVTGWALLVLPVPLWFAVRQLPLLLSWS